MTTPTHSHKHWTDEGGHVKLALGFLPCTSAGLTSGPEPVLRNIFMAAQEYWPDSPPRRVSSLADEYLKT
jgi:hypothetical protein